MQGPNGSAMPQRSRGAGLQSHGTGTEAQRGVTETPQDPAPSYTLPGPSNPSPYHPGVSNAMNAVNVLRVVRVNGVCSFRNSGTPSREHNSWCRDGRRFFPHMHSPCLENQNKTTSDGCASIQARTSVKYVIDVSKVCAKCSPYQSGEAATPTTNNQQDSVSRQLPVPTTTTQRLRKT